MSKEYDNNNTGALFDNAKKTTPKHPDMTGSATIVSPSGEVFEVWVSGWAKQSKKGDDFISLSFTAKDANASGTGKKISDFRKATAAQAPLEDNRPARKPAAGQTVPSLDDEVPF